jgi:signal transduction histidine kinase/ABC-type amino acid transport substrate-binding protein/ActR/RegA family two-component response regulator
MAADFRHSILFVMMLAVIAWAGADAPTGDGADQTAKASAPVRRIVVGTESAYPPYSFLDDQGRPAGYNVEFIRAVARVTGLDCEIRVRPWREIRHALEAGRIEAICGMYSSAQRDRLVDFSIPITVTHHAVLVRAGAKPVRHVEDLRGRRIVVMQHDIMHDWVEQKGLAGRLILAPTIAEGLKKLAAGEGDCGLFARLPALHWMRECKLEDQIEVTLSGLVPSRSCFAVGEGNLELASRLSEGISIVRGSGRADQIARKWLYSDQPIARTPEAKRFVQLGVLACRGKDQARRLWGLTADYLSREVPGYRFGVVPLDFDEVPEAVEAGRVDFVLANPAIYVGLEKQHRVSRIATLIGRDHRGPSQRFASVMVCRADRQDLRFAEDARGQSLAAVAETSFGGWLVMLRELRRRNIEPTDFDRLAFVGTQDGVIEALHAGRFDVGIVRGSLLDEMSQQGRIRREDYRILQFADAPAGAIPGETTRRYPQWPLAQLPSTDETLARKVASALLGMAPDAPAARASQSAGWTVPANYQEVHDCLAELNVWPYESDPSEAKPSSTESLWIAVLFVICMALLAWATWTFRLNRRLRLALRQRQRAERATAEAKESAETANRDLLAMNLQLEQAIRQANVLAQQAEEAATTKTEFLANMSHEIRTPLTAILGYAELLTDDTDVTAEQHQEHAKEICRNGQHLLMLINDILDLSKIEAGKFEIEQRPVNIRNLVQDVAGMMRIRAQQRGIALLLRFAEDLPQTLSGDEHRLRQLLVNLVGNAVKFTEQGSVQVVTSFVRNWKQHPTALKLEIIDTGVGMDPEAVRRIGEPFVQADPSTTRKFGGTGLGLAITSRLVDLLGGSLEVESTVGEGSTFRVFLPARVSYAQESSAAPEASKTSQVAEQTDKVDLEGLSVLVVEDNAVNQKLFSALLKKAGAEVDVAPNGQEGVDAARHRHFDVILMDMQMPVMDGYEATGELRRGGYDRPIIALTAHALQADRGKCLDAGCDDYLTKPINRQAVVQTIHKHVNPAAHQA